MAKTNQALYAFNRGLVSKYGLARTDVRRLALSAEIQANYIPKVLGSMSLRPGFGLKGTPNGNNRCVQIPFVFESPDDTALLELTDSTLRIRVADQLITRVAVSAVVTNGDFASFVGWTDDSDAGGFAGVLGGQLDLYTTTSGAGRCYQFVGLGAGDSGKTHALRIVVPRGPVTLRVGSTNGADDYVTETSLRTGTNSIAFVPTTGFYIEFSSYSQSIKMVDSCQIEAAGVLELPTPWTEALLPLVRWDQEADVIFTACDTISQYRIERRDNGSWSVVEYFPTDGPFRVANITKITLQPGGQTGNIVVAASGPLFRSTHVGALFKITSTGQSVAANLAGPDQYTNAVQITGVGVAARQLTINITGTWVGKLTLQQSLDSGLSWTPAGHTFTTNTTNFLFNDGFDNQIIQYRIGFIGGDYTSGTAMVSLSNPGGGITGVVRVTAFTDTKHVFADVITPLGGVNATLFWSEGEWSLYRGFPSAVGLYEGRLWWAGRGKIWGSVSDGFESFNEDIEGDSGTIARNIGRGPVDKINWLLPIQRLIVGSQAAEISTRSSSIDEILTPTNSNMKPASTRGSDPVPAVIVDTDGFYVHRSGRKLMRISPSDAYLDYASSDASIFIPEILVEKIVRIAVQRLPETRIHCVLTDGSVALLVFDDLENVQAWVTVQSTGDIEDVAVLPGDDEDLVYYVVNRNINGVNTRFIECWAFESQCIGGDYNYQADSHLVYTFGSPQNVLSVPHLIGKKVVVWADGKDLSPGVGSTQKLYTVDGSGNITLDAGVTVSHAIVGLSYRGRFQSSKLAYAAQMGTALLQPKIVNQVGVVAADMHRYGIRVGQDFDHLQNLPGMENGKPVDPDFVWSEYDNPTFPVSGKWNTDARLCMDSHAPRPATICAAIIEMVTDEKT